MAAYLHGTQPGCEMRANCMRVLRQALMWAGLWNDRLEDDSRNLIENPVIEDWYRTLIELTQQSGEDLLLEGGGNLGSPVDEPALPHFTGCKLTSKGRGIAEKLFVIHPKYLANRPAK